MMDAKVGTYFDLLAQIEQLQAEAEAIKDELKGQMLERETEELEGTGWRATPGTTPITAGSILSGSKLTTLTCTASTPSRPLAPGSH